MSMATKIERAKHTLLKFDNVIEVVFIKTDMRCGEISEKQQGYFLNSTGDIELKTIMGLLHEAIYFNRKLWRIVQICRRRGRDMLSPNFLN